MLEYCTVIEAKHSIFDQTINDNLSKGWQLQGSVKMINDCKGTLVMYQAMTKAIPVVHNEDTVLYANYSQAIKDKKTTLTYMEWLEAELENTTQLVRNLTNLVHAV